jgi:hypothetical protein
MFGHDNGQSDQVNNGLGDSAMMPEPVADDTLAATSSVTTSPVPVSQGDNMSSSSSEPETIPSPTAPSSDDLLAIKQHALQQLTPLVSHLNQTPEEKFHTTMMMIQSSDNQSLIKDAYAAAQQIPDDKTRAQALLDVVNEINYFTQHSINDN